MMTKPAPLELEDKLNFWGQHVSPSTCGICKPVLSLFSEDPVVTEGPGLYTYNPKCFGSCIFFSPDRLKDYKYLSFFIESIED